MFFGNNGFQSALIVGWLDGWMAIWLDGHIVWENSPTLSFQYPDVTVIAFF